MSLIVFPAIDLKSGQVVRLAEGDMDRATVYGDDQADKSYRETQGLLKANPNLKGIIAPTSVGIVAAAKAVVDAGLKFELSSTLVYLSIIQAERRRI